MSRWKIPGIRRSTSKYESSESGSSSSNVHQQARTIGISTRDEIWAIAFLVDGRYIVGGGREGKIRRWQVEDGREVGTPMDAQSAVFSISVSRDGRWIVAGTNGGFVTVWDAQSHEKEAEFRGHRDGVRAVDVSPDGTRIASGSFDSTACIRSLPNLGAGERLLGPLQHEGAVVATKFSPDGRLLATATWNCDSIRIYDSQNGSTPLDVHIQVGSLLNQSLAWSNDSKQLFSLSHDGNINCLDASSGTVVSRCPIHIGSRPTCIALTSDGKFIAASARSSVSFWDTATYIQIGPVIEHTASVTSMAMSANYDLTIGGGRTITIRGLFDILPLHEPNVVFPAEQSSGILAEEPNIGGTNSPQPMQEEDSSETIANLERTVQELREELAELTTSHRAAILGKDRLDETIQSLLTQNRSANIKIAHLETIIQQHSAERAESQQKANHERDDLMRVIQAHEQKHECEVLYAQGRTIDAAKFLLEIADNAGEAVRANEMIMGWISEFTHRCISTLERLGDKASKDKKHEDAISAYSTALSLVPSSPNTVLLNWASVILIHGSANDALVAANKFKLPRFVIYRAICDILVGYGRHKEAITCFRQMQSELPEDNSSHEEQAQWELDFRGRCVDKLEKQGDTAMNSKDHDAAIKRYSDALTLDLSNQTVILLKRCKARSLIGSWEEALIDAEKVIERDPSSHRGYEEKHAALHGMGHHKDAFEAFEMMLSKLQQSPDPLMNQLRHQYVNATPSIQKVIEKTIRNMPRVLIDTTTGRLYDKQQQVAAFKKLPIYDELRSSMTTRLDHARISSEVKTYYQYVMFSHRWEDGEPSYQKAENISIDELEPSSPNIKLQKLCAFVRQLGFQWVWSDTCCIDRKDTVVLQESMIAMFTWYHGSVLTIVYLRGVWSESQQPGDLRRSIWNTRAWTYQEYVAAKNVRFYTEDWEPYLGLNLHNHKESPAIVAEMQHAMGSFTQDSDLLEPGLKRVREKLYLASMRQTTLVEDIAYSLLGIFDVSIHVTYGEGYRSVGRLLEHILAGSGDVTILAWTGRAGSYNSCLPIDLTVYHDLVPPHVPGPIKMAEMNSTVTTLRSSFPDLSPVMMLYARLNELPSPFIAAGLMRLPGIVFPLTGLVLTSGPDPVTNLYAYHATTSKFGDVEFKTADDLTGMNDFCLVHPWIRTLLDQEFLEGASKLDRTTQALRFVARLRQPFGALLFELVSRVEHRRIAADSLIMIQIREEVSLTNLMDNIRTIEVH